MINLWKVHREYADSERPIVPELNRRSEAAVTNEADEERYLAYASAVEVRIAEAVYTSEAVPKRNATRPTDRFSKLPMKSI